MGGTLNKTQFIALELQLKTLPYIIPNNCLPGFPPQEHEYNPKKGCHVLYPFRTAVPLWGQTSRNLTGLSPKWDNGSKRVNLE